MVNVVIAVCMQGSQAGYKAEHTIHFSWLPNCGCNAISQSPQRLTPAFPAVMEPPSTVNQKRAFLS